MELGQGSSSPATSVTRTPWFTSKIFPTPSKPRLASSIHLIVIVQDRSPELEMDLTFKLIQEKDPNDAHGGGHHRCRQREAGFFVISGLLPDFSLNWVSYFPYCEDWVISLLSCALAGRFSICSGNFSENRIK
ncbi:hypothetical protein K1719_038473 [Acacia pycnantha]|nr:hypothetical protein K1719_038473 [Acacia pycnantha]